MAPVALNDPWLLTDEVARMLGVTAPTIRSWRHRRQGPVWYQVGPGSIRYRRSEVEAWLHANRHDPTPRSNGG